MNENINKKAVLSICISTYNRLDKLKKIIEDLLKIQSDEFNIIISDDGSEYDIKKELEYIKNDRLIVYTNQNNLGPIKNWFLTIDRGNGKYILQILDRDTFNCGYITDLIKLLKETDPGYGYICRNYMFGDSYIDTGERGFKLFDEKESMEMFALKAIHPTGFLVRRDLWEKLDEKERFFSTKYGIYPHRYIYAELSGQSKGIYISWNIYSDRLSNNTHKYRSGFYKKNSNVKFFWKPEAVSEEMSYVISYCAEKKEWSISEKKIVLFNRYKEAYQRIIDYKKTSINVKHNLHYGEKIAYISDFDLDAIIKGFKDNYLDNLKRFPELFSALKKEINDYSGVDYIRNFEASILRKNYDSFVGYKYLEYKINNRRISALLEKNKEETVCIYGYGELGMLLYKDLTDCGINVRCFIDKGYRDYFGEDVEVIGVSDKEIIENTDAIIISLPYYYDEICDSLSKYNMIKIYSLTELIETDK